MQGWASATDSPRLDMAAGTRPVKRDSVLQGCVERTSESARGLDSGGHDAYIRATFPSSLMTPSFASTPGGRSAKEIVP
jgi:hypothetical protein